MVLGLGQGERREQNTHSERRGYREPGTAPRMWRHKLCDDPDAEILDPNSSVLFWEGW